jgi:NADH dehydrogenase
VFGFKVSGFPAWFLWRTVYLMKMPGLARRLRVALDWTMDLLFPKDIVQLGLSREAPARESRSTAETPAALQHPNTTSNDAPDAATTGS